MLLTADREALGLSVGHNTHEVHNLAAMLLFEI